MIAFLGLGRWEERGIGEFVSARDVHLGSAQHVMAWLRSPGVGSSPANSLSRSSLLWEEELLGLRKASAVWEEASTAVGLLYLPCPLPSQQEAAFPQRQEWCSSSHLLSRLQRDDNEDGSPVHSSHTAAVAHEVVQDSGELGPHLPRRGEQTVSKE